MFAFGLWLALSAGSIDEGGRWHRVVGLLEYVEGDFDGAIASGNAAELLEQEGFLDEVVKQLEAAGPDGARWLPAARQLRMGAEARAPDTGARCGALARDIVSGQGLSRAPRHPPDLRAGARLYAASCAGCHGATGHGDGPAGVGLEPPPASFVSGPRLPTLTPYKAFNTTSFGIPGTAMPSYAASLTDDERWALSFYLFTLSQPACSGSAPAASWEVLSASTNGHLGERFGPEAVPCLRRNLPTPSLASLDEASRGLDRAAQLHRQGDRSGARQAVVDAYLTGLEPVEPRLRARDAALVARLEAAFTRTRLAAEGEGDFEGEVRATLGLLERARGTGASSFWSVFVAAFLILLREGFEAVVVVGALLAVLKKLKAPSLVRVVHAAWVSALLFGVLAFLFGQALFAGANREWLESVVALGAVGLLVYAAIWLSGRAGMSRFMTELRTKMGAAVSRGSVASLFAISFTSVGRESLETALFLEGLATDSRDAVLAGGAAGLVALLGLVLVVRAVGFRLPMKTLFSWSTVLLLATAVILLGKGLHGLQELGVLPLQPIRFFTVEWLGVFPDAVSLIPQLVLALLAVGWRRSQAFSAPAPGSGQVSPGSSSVP